MVSFSQITLDGMNLVGANSARAARLRAAHEFFDWMATLLTKTSGPRGGAG